MIDDSQEIAGPIRPAMPICHAMHGPALLCLTVPYSTARVPAPIVRALLRFLACCQVGLLHCPSAPGAHPADVLRYYDLRYRHRSTQRPAECADRPATVSGAGGWQGLMAGGRAEGPASDKKHPCALAPGLPATAAEEGS
ncbi:unnamed protein product [Calypogeia fissa]